MLKSLFPIFEWLPNYQKKNLKGDITAGITVGIMLIPQGMAYAMLAGLPPIYGLYAAIVPQFIYAIMGTSRQLAVGPVALDSLLVAVAVGSLAEAESPDYISLVILLAFMVGFVQLLMGLFRLGFLVNLLSHPVISGFTSAAAIIIAFSQLKFLLGIEVARSQYFHDILYQSFINISDFNSYSVLIGGLGIILIILINKYKKSIPAPFVVVVLGIFVSWYFGLYVDNLAVVGTVPASLPGFSPPQISLEALLSLSSAAFTLAIIGFMEATAISKAVKKGHNDYQIRPNQELIALGLGNIGGSFFKSFPTTGGFSRSAVNNQSGAKTNLAALISAFFVVLSLLFLTPVFYFLPKTILASIIMVAVLKLVSMQDAVDLWKKEQYSDFFILLITFLLTLFAGIQLGIAAGVFLSVLKQQWQNMQAEFNYQHEHFKIPAHTLLLQFKNQLYYGNAAFFEQKAQDILLQHKQTNPSIQFLIVDGSYMSSIDSTGQKALETLIEDCKNKKIEVFLSNMPIPFGMNTFSTIEAVLKAIKA